MLSGVEHLVDAYGCSAASLRSIPCLERVFARAIHELNLHLVGQPVWHVFAEPGGITGLVLLTESHLTVHTYPESEYAAFNLYCCRPRLDWPWRERLEEMVGSRDVSVRTLVRGQ